ncbi:MAG: lytic transglycosylase domain-containing protein [Chitinophagaceae bacterium]|nr:MAG: lytic transglycosylase domain-containing protein [Chitinophagaceae bacterium]
MLKKKLLRKGLFAMAMLIILAAVHATGAQLDVTATKTSNSDTALQWISFDENLLQFEGLTEFTAAEAPQIVLRKEAMQFANGYLARKSDLLDRIKEKNPKYFRIMDSVLRKYDLPVELKHLAIIESELNTKARSHVGAVGPWQFMATTARLLSLKVTAKYDERTHFYKSTVAAAKYLRDLHRLFDDWLLVIAAYNSGPGPVYKAIKKSGSRNFWKLQHFLPAETRDHVKKFISTHYYYEGKGSITTLTKAEAATHRKKMIAFADKHNQLLKQQQLLTAATADTSDNNTNKEEKAGTAPITLVALRPQE